jgi:hypothetical protein
LSAAFALDGPDHIQNQNHNSKPRAKPTSTSADKSVRPIRAC